MDVCAKANSDAWKKKRARVERNSITLINKQLIQ